MQKRVQDEGITVDRIPIARAIGIPIAMLFIQNLFFFNDDQASAGSGSGTDLDRLDFHFNNTKPSLYF